jgi:hypothetical protein
METARCEIRRLHVSFNLSLTDTFLNSASPNVNLMFILHATVFGQHAAEHTASIFSYGNGGNMFLRYVG